MSGIKRGFVVFAVVWAVGGCAKHNAPAGFLPTPKEAQSDVFGGWVDLTYRTDAGDSRVAGELIAASPDSLWVKDGSGGTVISSSDVIQGQLVGFHPKVSEVAIGVVLGTLSTISNGAFLIFSAPMWIIGGSIAASTQSKTPIRDFQRVPWTELAPFSRFPQGMPPGVDLRTLSPRGGG